jgi:four helix bundle protein
MHKGPTVEQPGAQREYDLEERSYQFARSVRGFVKRIPKTPSNCDDSKQLIRASGSLGANYIEANESLGNKDLLYHVRISCKEAKESRYWLRLLDLDGAPELEPERDSLIGESTELMRIFAAIIRKRSG